MAQNIATATSAANTLVNCDQAAPGAGTSLVVRRIDVTFGTSAPAAGTLVTLESPAGTVRHRFRTDISRSYNQVFPTGIECPVNAVARVAVQAAGGTSVAEVLLVTETDITN